MHRGRICAYFLIAVLAFSGSLRAAVEESSALQERVKAAFLYKFAAYVEWPTTAFPAPTSPIVIGVAGSEGVARELEQAIAGRQVDGRPMQVRRIKAGESAAACCQILFVGADSGRLADLLTHAEGQPVLTVTDAPKEHPKGSVINFLALEDRIRFDISREAAERNRLQLRSQLLSVARQVTR